MRRGVSGRPPSHGAAVDRDSLCCIAAGLCCVISACGSGTSGTSGTQGDPAPSEQILAASDARHSALVSEFASFNTPAIIDGRVEAIAVDGDTVFVGGSFTQVRDPLSEEIINQPYLFAYSKSSGNVIRTFDPNLNNDVYALETTGEGTGVFVGGVFGNLNGEVSRRGLVKIDDQGDRVVGFSARTDALVETLARIGNTLYVGGNFSQISDVAVENLAAVDTVTGALDRSLDLDFDGVLSSTEVNGVQGVDDIDITSDGRLMVVVGNFSSINGISRSRLAVIELDGQARVSEWNTDLFDAECFSTTFPQYIFGVDIAPDDSYFIAGTRGARSNLDPACDTISRLELADLSNSDVQPTWVNFTGGDSVTEVVSTGHAVYAGGHFRWLNNRTSLDAESGGPGSIERVGLAALDPLNGLTLTGWRSDRNPRGVGIFALVSEVEGLYVGDDTNFLNGSEHPKLKFLPVTTEIIDRSEAPRLPAALVADADDGLTRSTFDGTTFLAPSVNTQPVVGSGWQDVSGAMIVGDQLFAVDVNGGVSVSRLNEGDFGARTAVDLFGQTSDNWDVAQVSSLFFDYEWGRVYYTLQGDSRLFYRAFTPDGAYFGNDEFVAEHQSDIAWDDVAGMDVIGSYLYFNRSDGTLYRANIAGSAVTPGTTVAISGPSLDGQDWSNNFLAFMTSGD